MQLSILKTNLKSEQSANAISPLFDLHPLITRWNVDTEDIDNVLRIESDDSLTESEIVSLLKQYGVFSEPLKG